MVSLSSLCVLFILSLSALSAPIPNPQNTVSAPVALETQSLEVVTAAELTTPSQGGTFTDFKAIPSTGQAAVGTVNATVVQEPGVSRLVNRGPIPEEYRRFFIHGFGGGGGGCGGDCFDTVAPPPPKGKGKGKPPKKGAALPPALAPPQGAQGQ